MELTKIRKTTITCGHRIYSKEIKGKGVEWPCRAGWTGNGNTPLDPKNSCSKPKTLERKHGLTKSISFLYKPNQGPATSVPILKPSSSSSPTSSSCFPGVQPGRSAQKWMTTPSQDKSRGHTRTGRACPPHSNTGHDLSSLMIPTHRCRNQHQQLTPGFQLDKTRLRGGRGSQ